MDENGPVIRKKLVNGKWVKEIIKDPPKFNWKQHKRKKKKKRPKKSKKKKQIILKAKSNDFYKSHEYARWRYQVLKNSNGKCQLCGRSPQDGITLHADHIKPRHKYPHLAFDPNNGQVLCSCCNWGKYGDDETDWRKSRPEYLNQEEEWKGLKVIK